MFFDKTSGYSGFIVSGTFEKTVKNSFKKINCLFYFIRFKSNYFVNSSISLMFENISKGTSSGHDFRNSS